MEADDSGRITGGDAEVFQPVNVRQLLQAEDEVHAVGERAVALDTPADLLCAPEFARADGQSREVAFAQAAAQDEGGEHFARAGAGLIDGIGKGAKATSRD